MNPRETIRDFLEEYPPDRYGTLQPSGVGQMLGLAEARLQALALLLKRDPEHLRQVLDHLVYQTDLSDAALAEARRALGILNRKTLKELLEPYNWGDVNPETLGKPIVHTPDGSFVVEEPETPREWPKGYFDQEPLTDEEAEAFLDSIGRGSRKRRGRKK